MAAYEETIPTAFKNTNARATLLGQQQCCICCYSVGVPINMNVKRTCMDTNRWHICANGMHEPLLLHLGSRPLRSEEALNRRRKRRDQRTIKRAQKQFMLWSFSTSVEPYPGMFFFPICPNDCGVVPYCAAIYRFVSMFVELYPDTANYVHCELQDHCVVPGSCA